LENYGTQVRHDKYVWDILAPDVSITFPIPLGMRRAYIYFHRGRDMGIAQVTVTHYPSKIVDCYWVGYPNTPGWGWYEGYEVANDLDMQLQYNVTVTMLRDRNPKVVSAKGKMPRLSILALTGATC
jgi:hypothetical protein